MEKPIGEDLLYAVALSLVPQLGPGIYKNIISYSGSAKRFFELPRGKASRIPGIGPKLLVQLQAKDTFLRQAEVLLEEAEKEAVSVVTYLDPAFPQRLKAFPDAPILLFTRGNVNLNPGRTVGLVGTRNATAYGRAMTSKIVEDLAPYQPTIVSGLAYGIDIEAHRAALQHGLPTIGVLGTPINKIYPAHHGQTAKSMMETGGLVSEYRIGSPLNASNFPQRNRIIAGLSDAVVIVEAAKKGGALITAEIAYSYNKEIFAVPGNLQATYSEGCNNLIRTMKAAIYMGPQDIAGAFSWTTNAEDLQPPIVHLNWDDFEPMERAILQILTEEKEVDIDQLSWKSQIPIPLLASKLLNLEFQGLLKSLPGKKYQRTTPRNR
ncbi:Rossmann fold nucleotide-binding protein Smf possibly involved in DNA uptake [Lunatimonas lonarensis]|uniref:Rossmann fold nucleotide-binding protein Smf possibly involved in DNA uptake n=1 Tax=Lunatimonas lonarensis TaxID=1232681 RepID=R7ZLH6_9BACT|nr:DNA-processing protein DprA [Lunatimonas lonarensis]EON74951.1 Rossmann fold nucleotide-binding protein Smf possibly involved in DNA uptake [Lunatimonas lonarensis]